MVQNTHGKSQHWNWQGFSNYVLDVCADAVLREIPLKQQSIEYEASCKDRIDHVLTTDLVKIRLNTMNSVAVDLQIPNVPRLT